MELLQYLDMEETWLNSLEEKVTASDNLPESAEAVAEALEVRRGARAFTLTYCQTASCAMTVCPSIKTEEKNNPCRTL